MKIFKSILDVIAMLIIYIVSGCLAVVVYTFIHSGYNISSFSNTKLATSPVVSLLELVFLILFLGIFYGFKENKLQKRLDIRKINIRNAVYCVGLGLGVAAMSNVLVNILWKVMPGYEGTSKMINIANNSIGGIIAVCILTPILEEIVFRGMIFKHLQNIYKTRVAVILQALIFAYMHGNLLQGIYTFILGIILALAYVKTNSLFAPILIHCVFNIEGCVVINLISSKTMNMLLIVITLIIGGICGYKMLKGGEIQGKKAK